MKLYTEYTKAIKELEALKKAYFTTFNLDIGFFEKYLLPPLLGESVPDNIFAYEELNKELQLKENYLDIKVFYDANMMEIKEKRTILTFHPILIKEGLFHPKVIYLENNVGEGRLFVGSGNITFSGWGQNIEAFDIQNVKKDSVLQKQINKFFIDVNIKAGLRINKDRSEYPIDNDINFIYSFNTNENESKLLDHIDSKSSDTLYIWSPYFSEELDKLINDDEKSKSYFENIKEIKIIPDLVGLNKKIRLKNKPQNEKVKFYIYPANADEENRMNHSKIWITDSKIAIGSYNFTEQALFGTNFEAAIIKNIEDKNIDIPLQPIGELVFMDEEQLKNEKLETNTNFKTIFDLIANYKDNKIYLKEIISNTPITTLTILLPGNIEVTSWSGDEIELEDLQKYKFFKALVKNKYFKVFYIDELIYEGLVFEKDTKGYREPVKVESINDIFVSLLDSKDPISAKLIKKRNFDFDKSEEQLNIQRDDDSNMNYYNLFRGFYNLEQRLLKIENNNDLNYFCRGASNSMIAIASIIEEYKKDRQHQNLFTYLFIMEYNQVAQSIKNKIQELKIVDFKSIEPIENIAINLSKEDKNFLGEFYGNSKTK